MELDLEIGDTFRKETLNGEEYLVSPVVAHQEGVYVYPRANGRGYDKEFLPEEEIINSADEWEDTPLTLNHPSDDEGNLGLLNSRGFDAPIVGEFRDIVTSDGQLGGETWIRVNEIGEHDGSLREYIELVKDTGSGEVSTGYNAPTDFTRGTYNNESYSYVQRNLDPDHLALLTDEIGNCSTESGCGVGEHALNSEELKANHNHYLNTLTEEDDSIRSQDVKTYVMSADQESEDQDGTWVDEVRNMKQKLNEMLPNSSVQKEEDLSYNNKDEDVNGDSTTMEEDKRKTLIQEITNSSEIKEESLEGMGDTCLETTHESVVNSSEEKDNQEQETEQESETEDPSSEEITNSDNMEEIKGMIEGLEDKVDDRLNNFEEQIQAVKHDVDDEKATEDLKEHTNLSEATINSLQPVEKKEMLDELGVNESEEESSEREFLNVTGVTNTNHELDVEDDDSDIPAPGRAPAAQESDD